MGLLGGAALAGALGVALEPHAAEAAKCKDEGKKCDNKTCKKKNKKCCCKKLKCKQGRCEPQGGSCRTDVGNGAVWTSFTSSGSDTFSIPFGAATDPDGNVYVTDTGNERVLVFNASGTLSDEFGQEGNEDDEFQEPQGIGYGEDSSGNPRLYVADPSMPDTDFRFRKFRASGTNANEGNLGQVDLTNPIGVAVDADGQVWVVDSTMPGQIFLFRDNGTLRDTFTPGGNGALNDPEGIAVFEEDNRIFVYVADTGNDRLVKFEYVNDDLSFRAEAGDPGSQSDQFNQPVGIAIDTCGNLWVADRINNRIQRLDKNLAFDGRFNDGFNRPTGVALSPNGNSLYVVDSLNNRVVRYPLS